MAGKSIPFNRTEELHLIDKISRAVVRETRVFSEAFDEIEDGYNYLAGNQYTPKQKEWFKSVSRPARSFNLIFNLFNDIFGDWLVNEQRIKIHAMPGGNPITANYIQKLVDHAAVDNNSAYVFGKVMMAGLIKFGYAFPRFTDERHINGSLVIDNVDEFEMLFDSRSQNVFHDDALYQIRQRWMTPSNIKNAFPHLRRKIDQALSDIQDDSYWDNEDISDDLKLLMANPILQDQKNGMFKVVEYREMDWDDAEVVINPRTGEAEIFKLEGAKADLFFRANPEAKVVRRRARIKKNTWVIPTLSIVARHEMAELQDQQHDYIMFSGYTYGKKAIQHFGLFRNAKPIQDDFNEWRNEMADLMKKQTNPGGFWKKDHIENPNVVESYGREPGINIFVDENADINQVYRPIEYTKLPFGPDQMSQESLQFFQKITGATANLGGHAETQSENASLFAQRVQQAQKNFKHIYNNWALFKKRMWNKSIRIMQQNLTERREFTIVDPKNPGPVETFTINNDYYSTINVGRYEVTPEDPDNSPTSKIIKFTKKTEITDKLVAIFGPLAIIPEWWLESADEDLGDVTKLIERIKLLQEQIAKGIADQTAQQELATAIALAKQRLSLLPVEGNNAVASPGNGQVPQNNKRGFSLN